jgi:putative Mn2+ efflux pump MntP
MGTGLFVFVLGALLAFAVEDHVPDVNLAVAGLILMLAGAVIIWHARITEQSERTVTRREGTSDSSSPMRIVQETVRERNRD